ncbi:MAG TPA: hypothetical protein VMF06_16035 [Candidatus Limnocylindria bacterium]|jgi:hypothetical protein|nr:hypothetical protein [Candidatus Limnocylindria bacterium]
MGTRPDTFPALAAKQATLPEVISLFSELAIRAETIAKMQDEFLEDIVRHREARTGKPSRYTKKQQAFLDDSEDDAKKALLDIERLTAGTDDKNLLICALSNESPQIGLDEFMLKSYRPEDQEMVQQIIEYRKETIRLIEEYVATSPFKGQVVSIWHGSRKSKKDLTVSTPNHNKTSNS